MLRHATSRTDWQKYVRAVERGEAYLQRLEDIDRILQVRHVTRVP